MTPLFWTALQVAGLIELPCATPSKGACGAGGGVGVSGVAVGVVELFLSAIDAGVLWFRYSTVSLLRLFLSCFLVLLKVSGVGSRFLLFLLIAGQTVTY